SASSPIHPRIYIRVDGRMNAPQVRCARRMIPPTRSGAGFGFRVKPSFENNRPVLSVAPVIGSDETPTPTDSQRLAVARLMRAWNWANSGRTPRSREVRCDLLESLAYGAPSRAAISRKHEISKQAVSRQWSELRKLANVDRFS